MQRRQFTQALSLNAVVAPLSLTLAACGGGSPDSVASTTPSPTSERNATALTPVREAPAARKVGSYPQERILVAPGGAVYTLHRKDKTLKHAEGMIALTPPAPHTLKSNPVDAGFDAKGNVYVLDKTLGEVRVYSAGGVMERRFGERGDSHLALSSPSAIAVHDERIFIADSANHRIQIFSLAGSPVARFGAMKDQDEGFNYPRDIKVSTEGHIYVLHSSSIVTVHDAQGGLLSKHNFSKGESGQSQSISAIALSASGKLYLSDLRSGLIHMVSSDGSVSTQSVASPAKGKAVAARYIALGLNDQLYTSGLLPLMT